jgi:predicted RNase H-like nuclease (RuvC/YqgF family)
MSDRIVEVIESLDNKADFDRYSLNLRNRIGKLYNYHRYQKKLENLYKRRYDYRPKESSARALIGDMLGTHHEAIESLKSQLNDAQLRNQALEAELLKLMESRSWKLTEPLRKVNYGLTKYRSNGLKYIPKVDPEQIA